MDFIELVKNRYSVRGYKADPVEDEKLAEVLEAARLAPSAKNLQPFQLIVVHTKGREHELQRFIGGRGLRKPPLLLSRAEYPLRLGFEKIMPIMAL